MENAKLQSKNQNFKNLKKELPEIRKNILLKKHTTFKIGGPAKYFFLAKSKEDLVKAIKTAKKLKLPFFVLGGGSNLLVADEGFKGIVIKAQNAKRKVKKKNSKLKTIYIESGARLNDVVKICLEESLRGMEWAIGIPGTVGGAIKGNAGAFGSSMKDIVKEVEAFDILSEKIKILKNKDCEFKYRESIFKKKKNLIILSAELEFKKGEKKKIKEKIKEYLNYRKKTQPLKFASAGSIFKNPQSFFTGELIERCGLKGKKIGKVKISEIHGNFIVNLGGGKAKEVVELIKLIKKEVRRKFKIKLEEEIEYLGF